MSTDSTANGTLVIDDQNVHYNISRDEAQSLDPSTIVSSSVNIAKAAPWGNTLTVITAQSVGFWQNITGYTHVAVFGSILPSTNAGYTAWANYTIGGNYSAGNLTTSPNVITDYPLFISGPLNPTQQYNLTVDITASPDAPYLLDYILVYNAVDSTPISIASSTSSAQSSTDSPTSAAVATSHNNGISKDTVIYIGAGLGAAIILLSVLVIYLSVRLCCGRSRRPRPAASDAVAPTAPAHPFPPRPQKSATLKSQKSSTLTATTATMNTQNSRRGESMSNISDLGQAESARASSPSPARRTLSASAVPLSTALSSSLAPSPSGTLPVMSAISENPGASPAFLRSPSMPYLELPLSMAPPMSVPYLEPFAESPAPMPVLYNPYDRYAATTTEGTSSMRPSAERSTLIMSTASVVPPTHSVAPSMAPSVPATTESNTVTTVNAETTAAPTPSSMPSPTPRSAPALAAEPTQPEPSPSSSLVLGSNGFPKEKQEIRIEPPRQQLRANNATPPDEDLWEGPSDSPPAYGA